MPSSTERRVSVALVRAGLSSAVLLLLIVTGHSLPGAQELPPCPPASDPPLIVPFLGFQELPCGELSSCDGPDAGNEPDSSHWTAEQIRTAVGGEFSSPAPYQTVLNLGQDVVGAIAEVLPFEGQPLDLVRKPLRQAIKAGKFVVNLAGGPIAMNSEYRRARRDVAAALKANPNRPIIVMAYSWGTVPARQLLSYLEGRGANVQHVFLIDPIHLLSPRTPRQVRTLFDLDHPRLTVPDAYIDRTFVYRQSGSGQILKGEEVRASNGTTVPNLDVTTVPDLCAGSPATCTHGGIRTADFVVGDILAKLGCSPNTTTTTGSSTTTTSSTTSTTLTHLSGTWSICVTGDATGTNTVTGCSTCEPIGCTTTSHAITYLPRCWSRGPMLVQQVGSAVTYSASTSGNWCGPDSSYECSDSLTGSVVGDEVTIVYEQRITIADYLMGATIHNIQASITSFTQLDGTDSFSDTGDSAGTCFTNHDSRTGLTGPVQISITP